MMTFLLIEPPGSYLRIRDKCNPSNAIDIQGCPSKGPKITSHIVTMILATLPEAYKDEAQILFHENCDAGDIKEALLYFEGGMVYRLRACLHFLKCIVQK